MNDLIWFVIFIVYIFIVQTLHERWFLKDKGVGVKNEK